MIVVKKSVSIMIVLILVLALSVDVYAAPGSSSKGKADLININTAGVTELMKLPRVGEKIAQRIIDFRKKNGNFKKTADIMKVKGIGEKTFEKFKDLITV